MFFCLQICLHLVTKDYKVIFISARTGISISMVLVSVRLASLVQLHTGRGNPTGMELGCPELEPGSLTGGLTEGWMS